MGWRVDRARASLVPMTNTRGPRDRSDDDALLGLFGTIASRDRPEVARRLDSSPDLTARQIRVGATRQDAETYFLAAIRHYVYAGDTALHIAAASFQPDVARLLVAKGADVRARNRRGAEPIHYAADGTPGAPYWDPTAQGEVVAFLIDAGANPNALDKSGVAPLHRAVRTRSTKAARVLIENGADPRLMNKSGSTPLHLAVQNTGRSDSGSDAAKDEQRRIIALLLAYGARPTDTDANGKTVAASATSDWISQLLDTSPS